MAKHSLVRTEKPWGHELLWADTGRYAGKILHVRKGCRLSRQYHEVKDETLYVQSGSIEIEVGLGAEREVFVLQAGESFHLPPRTVHRMTALEDTDVFEASTPELDDVVRLQDDYGRA